jgi:hypothetical protein
MSMVIRELPLILVETPRSVLRYQRTTIGGTDMRPPTGFLPIYGRYTAAIHFIPCSNSATRLIVTGNETDNAFSFVGSGGIVAGKI